MSMDPPSGLSHSASFQDHSSVSTGVSQPHASGDDPAATLMTSHQSSHNSQASTSGISPPPFRSLSQSQYRQYPAPNSLPPVLPSSVSAPSIPSALALASPGDGSQNGDQIPRLYRSSQSKIESLKNWSISTYKCTKQMMFEKLGKTSRTVDSGTPFLLITLRLEVVEY
jgi:hypothetical protein